MGIVQTLVTVGGVVAIIGLLVLLFCHYLGGWTWTKAWLRSSGEEKMILTRAGTHRHFNPNGYMISSDSDLNLSGRGSFRRFDTTDHDYHLFRQGSTFSLTKSQQQQFQGPNIPPQPLRPAPIPPSFTAASSGQLTSQSSLDSVFNTAPSSPAPCFGPVPKIPPPPNHHHNHPTTGSSSSSHASPRSIMGDGNGGRGGANANNNSGNVGGGANGVATGLSSTNPFLPLLQASTQFFSQTIQSFQSGGNVGASTSSVGSNGDSMCPGNHSSAPTKQSSISSIDDPLGTTAPPSADSTVLHSASSSISIPPGSAGLSMGELLFSAPPLYQSKDIESRLAQNNAGASVALSNRETDYVAAPKEDNLFSTSEMHGSGYLASKHANNAMIMGSRPPVRPVPSGSPQHTRYNLYHQNSAESMSGSPGGGASGALNPKSHSPPPGAAGIRRASYPNRKEYTPHDTIPKSEFPQHIPYIPSPHHHHHHLTKGGVAGVTGGVVGIGGSTVITGKVGGVEMASGYNDPLRHHHSYLPPMSTTPVQPFLEEQEEPPEEPSSYNHQLPPANNPSMVDMEREDLKNRIMLETMREEIRIANERMADATKSLMMDDVFLPTTSSNTTSTCSNTTMTDGDGNSHQNHDSPRKQPSFGGNNLSSSVEAESSISKGNNNSSSSTTSTITNTPFTTTSATPQKNVEVSSKKLTSGMTSSSVEQLEPHNNNNSSKDLPTSVNNRNGGTDGEIGGEGGGGKGMPLQRSQNMYGLQQQQQQNEVKNGYGNGGAVNNSSLVSSTSGNHGMTTAPVSGRNNGEQSQQQQPDGSNGISASTLMNAMSNMSFNAIINSSVGNSRPPTVGAYFKQNSRSFSLRQSSTDSIGSDSDLSSPTDGSMPSLQRAMSCDSVCSDTSVILGDLDPPHMTGHLCIGLEYDSETADLLVNVMEAKELVGPDPDPNAPFDSYVRVYLLPDKTTNMQTRVYRKSLCPVYKEKFMFGLEMNELANRSLVFYLYATDKYTNTLIGEAELKLGDMDFSQPVITWLLLTDTGQRGGEFGEIMFSLSYLPTAERLTVVVVKARNLKFPHERETGDPFVKVYLLQRGKKVSKKKSSTKRGERNPIFNEAMIFSIPAHALQTIQLRITVADSLEAEGRAYSVGHVIVGSVATGKPLSHWNQMLSSLRKPIAMWHALRK